MDRFLIKRSAVLALGLVFIIGVNGAALGQAAKDYQPEVGQAGKDVVWVPTPQALVDKMLDMAKVTSKDYVIDLGSGDGRTVITAAKRGAKALGIEYNADMVELSKRNAEKEGVSDKATFMKADLFETDLSQATVITMFLLPSINMKLRPRILSLKAGTRVVSNSFDMEDWKPNQTEKVEGCSNWCTAHLWLVPAKIDGVWQTPHGELTLKQYLDKFAGTLRSRNNSVRVINQDLKVKQQLSIVAGPVKSGTNVIQITNGKIDADEISFSIEETVFAMNVSGGDSISGTLSFDAFQRGAGEKAPSGVIVKQGGPGIGIYRGRVNGNAIEGTQNNIRWTATRATK